MTRKKIYYWLIIFMMCICFQGLAAGKSSFDFARTKKDRPGRAHKMPGENSFRDSLAHYINGLMYDNDAETKMAIEEYTKAVAADPDNASIRLRLGLDYFISGKPDLAVKEIERAKVIDPDEGSSYFIMAVIYSSQGKYKEAQAEYEAVIKKHPGDMRALLSLADLFVMQKKLEDAKGVYEKAATKEPESAMAHFRLGMINLKLGKEEKGIAELKTSMELDSDFLEPYFILGIYYFNKHKFQEAADIYEKALLKEPLNEFIMSLLAEAYTGLGRFDQAKGLYEQLISLGPDDPENYRDYLIFCSKRKDLACGENVLKRAEEKKIKAPWLYGMVGYIAAMTGRHDSAVGYYLKGLKIDSKDAMLHFYLGVGYDTLGEKDKAVLEFKEALKLDAAMHEAANYLGYMYALDGKNLEEAENLVKKAIELDPGNGAYIDSLGWIYYQEGDYEKAAEKILEAVKAEPEEAAIREHLGDVYNKLGKCDEARIQWEKALELDPEMKEIKGKIQESQKSKVKSKE